MSDVGEYPRVELDNSCWMDPYWRLSSLYRIKNKDGKSVKFNPTDAQLDLLDNMWHRNVVLKARQLGFTTVIQLWELDTAMFNSNTSCGVVAHNTDDAMTFFRDKVKFAYQNLPIGLQTAIETETENASQMIFTNQSRIVVGTSLRSGTYQILHISEFGKLCAKNPERAREVITGAGQTVPVDGIIVIESTAEGKEGRFYDMTREAEKMKVSGKPLSKLDYKLHFYPWWGEPSYRLDMPQDVDAESQEYFDKLEKDIQCELDPEQKYWWVAKKRELGEDMGREYPGTTDEAFQTSNEGKYLTKQILKAHKEHRITKFPFADGVPVNTFWDIGKSDAQVVWFHQYINYQHRLIHCHGESETDLMYWAKYLNKFAVDHNMVFGKHYLPHDAAHERMGIITDSIQQQLYNVGIRNTEIVPKIDRKQTAITLLRSVYSQLVFHEVECAAGLKHLEQYGKKWNGVLGTWSDEPKHDEHSNYADALMQLAQAENAGLLRTAASKPNRPKASRGSKVL